MIDLPCCRVSYASCLPLGDPRWAFTQQAPLLALIVITTVVEGVVFVAGLGLGTTRFVGGGGAGRLVVVGAGGDGDAPVPGSGGAGRLLVVGVGGDAPVPGSST